MSDEYDEHDEPLLDFGGAFTDVATATLKPPTWVIRGLLPVGLTFIAAPPKSHKSGLTMAMAALSAGYQCSVLPSFMSEVVNGGPVMAFSFEATAGELRYMLELGMGVSLRADSRILVADDPWLFRLDDPDGLAQLLGWLDGRLPRMVILDPLRDFHSLDEKDSGDMNRLLRPLRTWAVKHEAAVIVVHHTKKLEEARDYTAMDMRGSTALFGIADGVLVLTPIDANATIKMAATFKRAAGWERSVQLSIYDWQDRAASELLSTTDKRVLSAARDGCFTTSAICGSLKLKYDKVVESLGILKRNGLLHNNGYSFTVEDNGDV